MSLPVAQMDAQRRSERVEAAARALLREYDVFRAYMLGDSEQMPQRDTAKRLEDLRAALES